MTTSKDIEKSEKLMHILEQECHVAGSNRKVAIEYISQALSEERQRFLDLVLPVLEQALDQWAMYANEHRHMKEDFIEDFEANDEEARIYQRARELLEKLRGLG